MIKLLLKSVLIVIGMWDEKTLSSFWMKNEDKEFFDVFSFKAS